MKFIIITACAIATLILSANAAQFKGCISETRGVCTECFGRKVLTNGQGCGPKLPPGDKCAFYETVTTTGKKSTKCTICKPGYAQKLTFKPGQGLESKCVQGSIENCLIEIISPFNKHACSGCSGGLYAVPNAQGSSYSCKKISNPLPNCKWGSIAIGNTRRCIRCNDGYALVKETQQCVKTNQTGCWVNNDNGGCYACNPYEGYSINAQGKCVKGGELDAQAFASQILNGAFGF